MCYGPTERQICCFLLSDPWTHFVPLLQMLIECSCQRGCVNEYWLEQDKILRKPEAYLVYSDILAKKIFIYTESPTALVACHCAVCLYVPFENIA